MPIFLLILALIAFDQLVKYWAFTVLQPLTTIPIVENIFHLTYVENRGAAFSLLMNRRWLFVILAVLVVSAAAIALKKGVIQTKTGKWSLYLITAGAVGNVIDRIARGFVVDLFDFRLIHFPVFNVADIFICTGAVLFFIYIMFQHKETDALTEGAEKNE
ncbi:signal peptidase II [Butyricicoccus sp. Marseille-Q5471]|uniref:signal peptidase II n=1 Tax=Butyricicoccus sp. Marseille-Q5471 TaxID=3039493 RepID=UPI0024BCCB36|nr:signal peptidase II [Butyricicoccus sp. Marseille-Q5471]